MLGLLGRGFLDNISLPLGVKRPRSCACACCRPPPARAGARTASAPCSRSSGRTRAQRRPAASATRTALRCANPRTPHAHVLHVYRPSDELVVASHGPILHQSVGRHAIV